MKDTAEIKRVAFQLPVGWTITHDELYDLSPLDTNAVQGVPNGISIWHLYFGQDLLQIRNDTAGLLLDAGWYPHADPSGCYGVKLIKMDQNEAFWDSPIETFSTRDLDSLISKISELLHR